MKQPSASQKSTAILSHLQKLRRRLFFLLRIVWLWLTLTVSLTVVYLLLLSEIEINYLIGMAMIFGGGLLLWAADHFLNHYLFQPLEAFEADIFQQSPPEPAASRQQEAAAQSHQSRNTTELKYNNEQLRLKLHDLEQMQTELKRRAQQPVAVAELGQSALKGTDLTVLMDETVTVVSQILEVEFTKILEVLPGDNSFILRTATGWPAELIGQAVVSANTASQSGYTLLTQKPVVVENLADEIRFKTPPLLKDYGIVSGITVIIQGRDKPFGVLGAHTRKRRSFTDDDLHFLQAVANVLATAIERKQNETQIVQRNRELLVLQSAGTVIMSKLDIQGVLTAVTREMAQLLEVESCAIFDWNDASDRITVSAKYSADDIQPADESTLDELPTNESYHLADFPLTKQILMTKQALQMTINQPNIDTAELARMQASQVKTRLIFPMVYQERVMGLVDITDSRLERIFTGQEIGLAKLLANQAGSAIANARLYEEVHQYLEELTTLNMISQTITSSLDLRKTLTLITQQAIRLVGVEAVSVALYDEVRQDLWFAAVSGGDEEFMKEVRLQVGQGIVGWVVEHDEPILVPDVTKDPRFFKDFDRQTTFTTHSILCVPLQTKGKTIGAIQAINKQEGLFDQEDLRLLSTLVAPATTAIVNARLFERAQQEIVERKRAEQALQEERALLAQRVEERTADLRAANLELARAARLKDEFLASMSHELRTPLTAILGLCEVLDLQAYGELNQKQLKAINNIEESGRHLLALINDILDLSKIEAGKLELEIGPVSVKEVCETSLQFLKQMAHKKEIQLSLKLDDQVSIIQADERRLKQILVNLLSNAVKFTPDGGSVGLDVKRIEDQQKINFTIWDTGIGIADKDIGKLFDAFTQLDSSLARQHTGTGLGLALVSRMVELHHGEVTVESQLGQGSRFTVSLPWQKRNVDPKLSKTSPTSTAHNQKSVIQQALIVEDSQTAADQLSRYLQELNISAVIYPNGEGVLGQVFKINPDIIFLDIMLPNSSGWTVLAELKAESRTKNIPVLITSVLDERTKGLQQGAAGYLVKPITKQQLVDALAQIPSSKAAPNRQVKLQKSLTPPQQSSPLILVAEDEQQISALFKDYLTASGYRVRVAYNGLQALEQATQEKPDLVLMDIQMPDMDGLTAISKLRAQDALAHIPVIALTARAMPGDRERCLEAGANDYLSKPVNLVKLSQVIKHQLEAAKLKLGVTDETKTYDFDR